LAGITLDGEVLTWRPRFSPAEAPRSRTGLTLASGTIKLTAADSLSFQGTQTLDGTGTRGPSPPWYNNGFWCRPTGYLIIATGITVEQVGACGQYGRRVRSEPGYDHRDRWLHLTAKATQFRGGHYERWHLASDRGAAWNIIGAASPPTPRKIPPGWPPIATLTGTTSSRNALTGFVNKVPPAVTIPKLSQLHGGPGFYESRARSPSVRSTFAGPSNSTTHKQPVAP